MSEVMPSDVGTGSHCVTVKEVMAIYRIGRCTAYEQAALYLRKGPGHGIPCLTLGHSLRFPLAWIEDHIGRRVVLDASNADDDTRGTVDLGSRRPRHLGLATSHGVSARRCAMNRDDDTMNRPALADGLRAWATGSYCAEAAVDLLVEHEVWLSRLEFRRLAVWTDPADGSRGDATRTDVGIDWDAAANVLASAPASASERRVLALVIGLAAGDLHPVDLGDALCGLDRRNTAHVLRAVAHAAGLHERNVQFVVDGAVGQVTSM